MTLVLPQPWRLVPGGGLTLRDGDVISITIVGVGTLRNSVVQASPIATTRTGGDEQ